jgi:hypothetical protein
MGGKSMRDWEAFVREHLSLPEMKGHREERMISELAAHLADVFDEALRRGANGDEAEALVLEELGDREAATRELIRSEPAHVRASANRWAEGGEQRIRRSGGVWASLADRLQEIRLAIRSLGRRPLFSSTVVLVLALGIAANTAIFSLVQAVILDPLPFPEADRLVGVWHTAPGRGIERVGHPHISYLHYRSENRVFEEMGAYRLAGFSLTGAESPERLGGAVVTPSVFQVLGVNPVEGRTFLEEEGRPASDRVVMLSHSLWNRRYGGDPDIVGQAIVVDGRPHTVVGVMPTGFDFPTDGARRGSPA